MCQQKKKKKIHFYSYRPKWLMVFWSSITNFKHSYILAKNYSTATTTEDSGEHLQQATVSSGQ